MKTSKNIQLDKEFSSPVFHCRTYVQQLYYNAVHTKNPGDRKAVGISLYFEFTLRIYASIASPFGLAMTYRNYLRFFFLDFFLGSSFFSESSDF